SFVRGYVWVDVTVSGRPLRFVGTQLESQSTDVALAQARELLSGPAAVEDRPVVVGCDCNLDADGPAGALLQGAGLADAWAGPSARAWSECSAYPRWVLDDLSPQRRRMVLGVGSLAVLLVVVLVVTGVVRARASAVHPVAQDQLGPVLLVPGYGGTGSSLQPL